MPGLRRGEDRWAPDPGGPGCRREICVASSACTIAHCLSGSSVAAFAVLMHRWAGLRSLSAAGGEMPEGTAKGITHNVEQFRQAGGRDRWHAGVRRRIVPVRPGPGRHPLHGRDVLLHGPSGAAEDGGPGPPRLLPGRVAAPGRTADHHGRGHRDRLPAGRHPDATLSSPPAPCGRNRRMCCRPFRSRGDRSEHPTPRGRELPLGWVCETC